MVKDVFLGRGATGRQFEHGRGATEAARFVLGLNFRCKVDALLAGALRGMQIGRGGFAHGHGRGGQGVLASGVEVGGPDVGRDEGLASAMSLPEGQQLRVHVFVFVRIAGKMLDQRVAGEQKSNRKNVNTGGNTLNGDPLAVSQIVVVRTWLVSAIVLDCDLWMRRPFLRSRVCRCGGLHELTAKALSKLRKLFFSSKTSSFSIS